MNYESVSSVAISTLGLCLLLGISIGNREIPQLIRILVRCNNTQIITQLLLLKVTLRKVLQLTLGKLDISGNCDGELGGVTGDDNVVLGEVAGLSLDLDTFLEVFLEGGDVQYLIVNGMTAVDDELDSSLLAGLSLSL